MIKLLKLELRNNKLLYSVLLFFLILSVFAMFYIRHHVKSNQYEYFYLISMFFISPILMFITFTSEKWGLYFLLENDRKKQLYVKVMFPLLMSIIYNLVLLFVFNKFIIVTISHVGHIDRLFQVQTFGEYMLFIYNICFFGLLTLIVILIFKTSNSAISNRISNIVFLIALSIMGLLIKILISRIYLLLSYDLLNKSIFLLELSTLLVVILINYFLYRIVKYYYIQLEI